MTGINLGRLGAIIRKEFIQMSRDRTTLGMLLGIPIFQLTLFGYAIRQDVRNLPTVAYDQSRTQESRALIQQFEATGNFLMRGQVSSYTQAIHTVDSGRARAAIVIPEGYARDLKGGRPTDIQVLVDATDPSASQSAIAAAQLVGQRVLIQIVESRAGNIGHAEPPLDVRVRPLYNPALKSALFIVPGVMGMIISNILIIITAMAIVREREQGTLEQLIVTPLTPWEIMLGKITPYVLVGLVQVTAVLIVGHLLFGVPVRGSLLVAYGASLLFITANLGLGLFISTVGKTQAQAMQTSFFFLLPNVLLSGFMFPREAMPPGAQQIGLLLPLTYFLQVIRGVVLKGVGITELWPQCAALLAFAILFFSFASLRFHKQLE